jgi:uncharacterized repeat protein (TIGR03806 family)
MKIFGNKAKVLILVVATIVVFVLSCKKDLLNDKNNISFFPKLSDYGIYKGDPANLIATDSFKLYELSSQLFTDYAEKQRLVKLPANTQMGVIDNGLVGFPDGTILVKTFFYYHDKGNTAAGKRIIETRLLIKAQAKWNVGVYIWNDNQTEAYLSSNGQSTSVKWIDENGVSRTISYHIPNNKECATCHNSHNTVIPIGPKVRNLNRMVVRNNSTQNQLEYFHQVGLLNAIDPALFDKLPDYANTAWGLDKRARAYFEINCSHCHKDGGFNGNRQLWLSYEKSFEESNLHRYQNLIVLRMQQHRMPKLGTTIIHDEGLALIRAYVDSLP